MTPKPKTSIQTPKYGRLRKIAMNPDNIGLLQNFGWPWKQLDRFRKNTSELENIWTPNKKVNQTSIYPATIREKNLVRIQKILAPPT